MFVRGLDLNLCSVVANLLTPPTTNVNDSYETSLSGTSHENPEEESVMFSGIEWDGLHPKQSGVVLQQLPRLNPKAINYLAAIAAQSPKNHQCPSIVFVNPNVSMAYAVDSLWL